MGILSHKNSYSTLDGYERASEVEPNPSNYQILETFEINGHLVAVVLYPNCTNYEGKKILLFKNLKKEELLKVKELDPHFSKNGISPFARFEPTPGGLVAAKDLCGILD